MTRKRANGDGSIYQAGKGWVASVTIRQKDGSRRRVARRAKTRDRARIVLQQLINESASVVTPSSITFDALAERWIAGLHQSETTVFQKKWMRTRLLPIMGQWRVQDITRLTIDDAYQRLITLGVGSSAIRQMACFIRHLLDYAVSLEIIADNPAAKLKGPRVTRKPIEPFSAEEARTIMDAARGDRLHGAFVCLFFCGLRQGELFGLRWRDIDWQARSMSIHRQAVLVNGKTVVRETKTGNSTRSIPLPAVVLDALSVRHAAAREERHDGLEDHVFPARNGKPYNRANFNYRVWKPVLGRCGLKLRGPHHARHSCATLLIQSKVPIQVVAAILGHSSAKITLSTYAHVLPRATHDAMSSLETTLGCSAVATKGRRKQA